MLAFSQGGASTPTSSAATVHPEDALAKQAPGMIDKVMSAYAVKKLAAEGETQEELAEQERIKTDEMKATGASGTAGRLTRDALQTQLMEIEYDLKRKDKDFRDAQTALANADVNLKELEYKIGNEIAPYRISSAKSGAAVAEKEVTFYEIRNILMNLDIPEKQAMAKWFESVGAASPAAKAAMSIGQWLKMIFGK